MRRESFLRRRITSEISERAVGFALGGLLAMEGVRALRRGSAAAPIILLLQRASIDGESFQRKMTLAGLVSSWLR